MHVLTELQAEHLLEKEKLPIVKRKLCTSLTQAQEFAQHLGYPVVAKVSSNKLIHKSEINSVRTNIAKKELPKIYRELNAIQIQKQGILIQKQEVGKEILIGLKKDPTFGHVIVVGIGGIYTQIMKDISMRIAPITTKQAKEMVHELKAHKILEGYRGYKINTKKLLEILVHVSNLPEKYPHIQELDINPIIINQNKATIVDARMILEKTQD